MKHLIYLSLLIIAFGSCKKEVQQDTVNYLEQVKKGLKDSVSVDDYGKLDFSNAIRPKVDSVGLYMIRIPFSGKSIATDFVLVQTNREGKIQKGKIVHISKSLDQRNNSPVRFNGSVLIQSLQRQALVQSPIENGYIKAFHTGSSAQRMESMMDPTVLPEVIVVAYIPSDGGVSYSDWMSLVGMMGSGDPGGSGGFGGNGSGDSNGGGSGSGEVGGYYTPLLHSPDNGDNGHGEAGQAPVIEVEPEYIYSIPSVNLNKIFKCFDYVPSAGANFTIKLCADLPINSMPTAMGNSFTSTAGHTFLTITKTNGIASVVQSFGYYPKSGPSWADPFSPVSSVIKDNGAQEINASLEMNINESQFNVIKQNALAWSSRNYELGDYNCTSYAVDIFNSVRVNPIVMSPYQVSIGGNYDPYNPASQPSTVSIGKSPQMLFVKLQQMKNSNGAEATQIKIDQSHNYHAPISHGECN